MVLDYGGGTYIAQSLADSANAAVTHWISTIRDEELEQWGISREELSNIATSDRAVPLDGLLNVWCLSGSGKRGLALINVIATDQSRV
jgi:hypothetical protein